MKIAQLFAVLLLLQAAFLPDGRSAQAETAPEAGGSVCRWTFDGTLSDNAGNDRDDLTPRDARGQAVSPRVVGEKQLPGVSGAAVALGVESADAKYLTAAVSSDVALGPSYTIEAWIYPTRLSEWNRLVLRWGAAGQYAYHLALHRQRLSLCHGQADGKYVFAEGGRLETGRWHHVVGVARRGDEHHVAGTLNVYLNGRPVGSGRFDGTIGSPRAEPLGIGDSAGRPSPGARYRGYIDSVTMFNRALSPEEIRARFDADPRAAKLREFEHRERTVEIARRATSFAKLKKLGVEEIVFAERAPGRDPAGHYYANFGYSCIDPSYWLHGADGGRLVKLNLRTGELAVLLDDPGGAVRDPRVHFDAKKILFSYRKGTTHHYNLYEIGADGSGLVQITSGDWDDVEPAYLPDGGIIFCSTRCKRYIGCWLAPSATLHRCDADGGNIRMLSSGAFTENTPAVLPDGRVLYTRWEYVNRDPVSFHHLWTMNPDGTNPSVYFGNMHPGGVFIDAVPIPASDRVLMIHSPAHGRNEHAGHVATVTGRKGPDEPSAMRNVSRAADYRDPYPLSGDAFLVARGNQILLMDSAGRTETLYTAPMMVHEPRPIVRRPPGKVRPSQVDPAKTTGTLIVGNVYSGRNMDGAQPGSIKRLLVLENLPKPANFHGGGSQPIGHGVTSTLKRILGTVPVEPDGSACFEVPAMRSIYLALLDENDLSIKQMRSFVTLQPGETRSCVGCHESPRKMRPCDAAPLLATARGPSRIKPIDGAPEVMDFPRDIQPILDRHCVACHNTKRRDGGVSLVGDHGPVFSLSYYELLLHWQVKDTAGNPAHGTGRQRGGDRPSTTYSSASPLMKKIDGSHYNVHLSAREKTLVRLWIDTSAQYAGTYAAYGTGQIGGCWGNNRPVRVMDDAWPETPPAAEAVQRRCGACHRKGDMPRHVTDRVAYSPWGDMLSWTRPLSRYSRHRIFNLSHPERSLMLLAALPGDAGGYADPSIEANASTAQVVREDRSRPPKPVEHPVVFTDTSDPDYGKILAHIRAAGAKLRQIKRFDMPGFRPSEHYVRELQRDGVLPASFDLDRDPIDVYATDRAYWRSFWSTGQAKAER